MSLDIARTMPPETDPKLDLVESEFADHPDESLGAIVGGRIMISAGVDAVIPTFLEVAMNPEILAGVLRLERPELPEDPSDDLYALARGNSGDRRLIEEVVDLNTLHHSVNAAWKKAGMEGRIADSRVTIPTDDIPDPHPDGPSLTFGPRLTVMSYSDEQAARIRVASGFTRVFEPGVSPQEMTRRQLENVRLASLPEQPLKTFEDMPKGVVVRRNDLLIIDSTSHHATQTLGPARDPQMYAHSVRRTS